MKRVAINISPEMYVFLLLAVLAMGTVIFALSPFAGAFP